MSQSRVAIGAYWRQNRIQERLTEKCDVPGERCMAELEVKIGAVGGVSLTVIVESEDGSIWQWNTSATCY